MKKGEIAIKVAVLAWLANNHSTWSSGKKVKRRCLLMEGHTQTPFTVRIIIAIMFGQLN